MKKRTITAGAVAVFLLMLMTAGAAMAAFGSGANGGLSATDITGITSSTNIVAFLMTIFKWGGITILAGAVTYGSFLLIVGLHRLSKSGGQDKQESKGAIIKIAVGACMVVIPIIIAILAYTMNDANTRNSGIAPSVNADHVGKVLAGLVGASEAWAGDEQAMTIMAAAKAAGTCHQWQGPDGPECTCVIVNPETGQPQKVHMKMVEGRIVVDSITGGE